MVIISGVPIFRIFTVISESSNSKKNIRQTGTCSSGYRDTQLLCGRLGIQTAIQNSSDRQRRDID